MNRLVATAVVACAAMSGALAQELLDRVLARVDGEPITLSDTRAAIGLGLVEPAEGVDPILFAVRQLIERRLVLAEVARFAPPEPGDAALDAQVKVLQARVGSAADLAALQRSTGYGPQQIRDAARDSLRIQAYLSQRFGPTVQPTDEEVGQYYRTHPDEFTRDGRLIPFAEAEPAARQKAADERRRAVVFQWMRELHQRADIVELYETKK
jgi:hypothetical protein